MSNACVSVEAAVFESALFPFVICVQAVLKLKRFGLLRHSAIIYSSSFCYAVAFRVDLFCIYLMNILCVYSECASGRSCFRIEV